MGFKYVVDGHCDTITALEVQNRNLGEHSNQGQLDLPRLFKGQVNVQFFAIFVSPRYKDMSLKKCLQYIERFYQELNLNQDKLGLALCFKDIACITASGKIAALLAVEGGESLTGDLGLLRILYRLGVRSLTLTWNHRNELGDGVAEGKQAGGLSLFGRKVVREMNNLGMLVDVAHLSDQGFWDVAETSIMPFAATHANCRTICNHPRNISDPQIKYLAKTGGIIGLTYVPEFIDPHKPGLESLIRHIDYIASLTGTGCIGLGSDFDGMETSTPGLHDAACKLNLAETLLKHGYSDHDVSGIMGGNWMRLLEQVLK